MTQPTAPAGTPSSAPASTSTPPAQGQPAPPAQPTVGAPAPPAASQAQPGWPQQPQGHQGPPVHYVPVMPVPSTLAAATPPAGDSGQGGDSDGQDLSKLPQWAQKQIQTLRDENAKRRVSERSAVVNQHAWVAAQQMGVNGQALFGSLAWQKAVEQLDPSKPDFGRHLAETIWRTVQENPWMGAQPSAPPAQPAPGVPGQQAPVGQQQGQPPTPGAPGQPQQQPYGVPQPYGPYGAPAYPGAPAGYPAAYPAQGWPQRPAPPTSGAEFAAGNTAGAPVTEAQLAQMSPEDITKALEEGRLKHLL